MGARSATIRGGLRTPIALYVLDALILGLGAITFIVGWVMVVLGVLDVVRGAGSDRASRGMRTIIAYAILDAAVFGTNYGNNKLAHHRAEQIAVALDAFKADHGSYPATLEQLVPRYLPSVPLAKYTLMPMYNRFDYSSSGTDRAFISYVAIPPFGRPFYRLETKKWGYLD
jgi:hypothetical protein